MVDALNTPQRTVERWLNQLKEHGLIEFRGAAKTDGYYYLETANEPQHLLSLVWQGQEPDLYSPSEG
jgi:DNA-binding transcriptional ArsR family regulator